MVDFTDNILAKEIAFDNVSNILHDAGYCNAFIEISPNLTLQEFESLCNFVVDVTKNIAKFINIIAFRKNSILILLDPVFDFCSISAFENKKEWSYYLDPSNLNKGFFRKIKNYPVLHIVKPIIWTREAKA